MSTLRFCLKHVEQLKLLKNLKIIIECLLYYEEL